MSLLDQVAGYQPKLLRPSGGCHNCPLKRVGYTPPKLTQGRIIFVSVAPDKHEVAAGRPLVGPSGETLEASLRRAGIEDYSFTFLTHCPGPGKDPALPRAAERCLSQFVLEEVRGYDLVVLIGSVVLRSFFPGATGKKYRGSVAYHPDFPGQKFYTLASPGHKFRDADTEQEWGRHIDRLGRIYAGEPPPDWRILQRGGEEYQQALLQALEAPLISLDVETNRLESWLPDSRLRSVALTADGKTVLFAHDDQPHFLGTLEHLRAYLMKPEKAVVGHNIGFDLDWIEEELGFRVRCRGIHDTGPIFYQAGQYKMPSLKELVSKELDGYRFLVHSPATETDLDLLARYNAEDVVYPLELFRKGMTTVKPKTRDLLSRVSGPSGYVLRKVQRNGFLIRREHWEGLKQKYEAEREEIITAWRAADPAFIPGEHETGHGFRKYLFEVKGLTSTRQTDKGAPSTDASALKAWVREGHEYLKHALALKGNEKIQSTYLSAYDNHVNPIDGRIHASFTNTHTDSGRSSSRSPNLQNIPRRKEIRDLFGVQPGRLLMEADFSQIEFRIMVCLARDRNGIEAYNRGEDAHTTTARSFSSGQEPTKEQRNWAKAINFALLFGGDWRNVQITAREWYGLEFTEKQSRDFEAAFWQTYPQLPDFHKLSAMKLEKNRGWFESVTGHVFFYEDWDHGHKGKREHSFRSALNAEAQGPAAQICFLTMIHADRLFTERGIDVMIVNTVHDSMILDVGGPEHVGPVVAAVEEAREIAAAWVRPWFPVPLVMDYELGTSWGSLQSWAPAGRGDG